MRKYILDCLKGKYGFWMWLVMWMPIWGILFNLAYFITKALIN